MGSVLWMSASGETVVRFWTCGDSCDPRDSLWCEREPGVTVYKENELTEGRLDSVRSAPGNLVRHTKIEMFDIQS